MCSRRRRHRHRCQRRRAHFPSWCQILNDFLLFFSSFILCAHTQMHTIHAEVFHVRRFDERWDKSRNEFSFSSFSLLHKKTKLAKICWFIIDFFLGSERWNVKKKIVCDLLLRNNRILKQTKIYEKRNENWQTRAQQLKWSGNRNSFASATKCVCVTVCVYVMT